MKFRVRLFVTASFLLTGSLAYAAAPVADPASPRCAASPAAASLAFLEASHDAALKAVTFCGECSTSGCNTAQQVNAPCGLDPQGHQKFCWDTGLTCSADGRVQCSCHT